MKSNATPLIMEILEYKVQMWDNNQFCDCGAESLKECECSSDKKKRFLQRRKRKVNEKFSDDLDRALKSAVKTETTG